MRWCFTYGCGDSNSCTGDIIIFTQFPDRIAGIHLGTDEVPTGGCISGDAAPCLIASAVPRCKVYGIADPSPLEQDVLMVRCGIAGPAFRD